MNQDAKLFFGKYRGKVTNNMDLLGQGRICANVPAVFGEKETGWALPSVPYAGNGVGMFFIPPIGANVWIEFKARLPGISHMVWMFLGSERNTQAPTSSIKMIKTDFVTITLSDVPLPILRISWSYHRDDNWPQNSDRPNRNRINK